MTEDRFDELLARAAPARPNRGGDLDGAWPLMVRDARDAIDPERPRRRMNAFVTAAAAILLVGGGGGVAVAAGLVSWPVGFEDPDAALEFELPSGRVCEIRLIVHDLGDAGESSPDDAIHHPVQAEVTRWLREDDPLEALDLVKAEAEVDRIYAEQRSVGMTIAIGADGWLEDTVVAPGVPDADDAHAFAINRAISAAMREHLLTAGFAANTWNFGTEGGVKCAAE